MTKTVKSAPAKPAASTNDSGRVHVGGGLMRFASTKSTATKTHDAGKVHVGGGLMRF
jgi:hypothetical protein